MGMKVLLETDPAMKLAPLFPRTDGKAFARVMFGIANEPLEEGLGIDLSPFYCVAEYPDEDAIRAERGNEADLFIADVRRNNEYAWKPPDRFLAALEQLGVRLEHADGALLRGIYEAIDPTGHFESYLRDGDFRQDIAGCLEAVCAAKERGATRVRFFAYY